MKLPPQLPTSPLFTKINSVTQDSITYKEKKEFLEMGLVVFEFTRGQTTEKRDGRLASYIKITQHRRMNLFCLQIVLRGFKNFMTKLITFASSHVFNYSIRKRTHRKEKNSLEEVLGWRSSYPNKTTENCRMATF